MRFVKFRKFIQYSEIIEPGEIGIFVLNGEGYIKKLGINELISLNPDPLFSPIPFGDGDCIRCVGRVIGHIDPSCMARVE